MTNLGWLYDKIFEANTGRSMKTMIRRIGKLAEEYGELWEAYLNVTSLHNGKDKTWDDVREEAVDVAIVALDIVATRLPTDAGKNEEQVRQEIVDMVNKKLEKWKKTSTEKKDAVSEEGSI